MEYFSINHFAKLLNKEEKLKLLIIKQPNGTIKKDYFLLFSLRKHTLPSIFASFFSVLYPSFVYYITCIPNVIRLL